MLLNLKIAIRVPDGTYGRLCSRSGLCITSNIHVGAGTIDRDYTGIQLNKVPIKNLKFVKYS
jgi:dUTPase